MINTSRETTFELVLYIKYLVQFPQKNDKDKNKDIRTQINLGSEVNAMYPTYTTKLGFYARKIDVNIQKIDKFYLDTFEIVIADYSVKDKLQKVEFF